MTSYSKIYHNQCSLLIKILPYINDVAFFALKGGTAINFFHQNMPRLSVDIDLTYLPLKSRQESLLEINQGIQDIAARVQKDYPKNKIVLDKKVASTIPKFQIQTAEAIVKERNRVKSGILNISN